MDLVTKIEQQERPTTRWRREERPITRTNEIDDPQIQPGTHRPISRRGVMSRQTAEERPYTQQSLMRPMTAGRPSAIASRPPTASSLQRSAMTRSSSRLTSIIQSTPNRTGTAMGLTGLGALERPITQQGLSGMKTSGKGPMRQVQDKRYFEGILQMKIRELTEEILRLSRDIDSQSREQSTFLVYDSRVKEMASELTDLQGLLADYNLVVDKLNTDTDKGDIDAECQELRTRNDHESLQLEQQFAEQKQKEADIKQLEVEINQERHMTDNLLAAMSPDLMEQHKELLTNSNALQKEMELLQQQLDTLATKGTFLNDQLSMSQVKREAVHLYHKLHEVEERRNTLLEEEKTRATPAQEREQLLQRVKDDNAEMATMEQQITELKDDLRRRRTELEQIEQDLDESQSERHQKFRELRRREETMEQFLSTFDETRDEEMSKITSMEAEVVSNLQQMSRNLGQSRLVPSTDDYSAVKDHLGYRDGDTDKARKSVDSVTKEFLALKTNLQNMDKLEAKVQGEMETLKEQMEIMNTEIVTLSDLETLRQQAKEKQASLEKEQAVLEQKRTPTKETLMEVHIKHDQLKKQLEENETYIQLSKQEMKLAQLEMTNFSLQEFVASKKTETEYEPTKAQVFLMVKDFNRALKENLKAGPVG